MKKVPGRYAPGVAETYGRGKLATVQKNATIMARIMAMVRTDRIISDNRIMTRPSLPRTAAACADQ